MLIYAQTDCKRRLIVNLNYSTAAPVIPCITLRHNLWRNVGPRKLTFTMGEDPRNLAVVDTVKLVFLKYESSGWLDFRARAEFNRSILILSREKGNAVINQRASIY